MRACWAAAGVLLLVLGRAAPGELPGQVGEGGEGGEVRVGAAGDAAGALAALVTASLRAHGVAARRAPAPAACAPSEPADGAACRHALLGALVAGSLHVALLPVPATASSDFFALREFGVEDAGDAAPLARRACFATRPPARSLLDLAEAAVALRYRIVDDELESLRASAPRNATPAYEHVASDNSTITPEWCSPESCATLLVEGPGEVSAIAEIVREHRLRARVAGLAAPAAPGLGGRAALLCTADAALSGLAESSAVALGPPACRLAADSCPFEPRRLVKLVNVRVLAALSPRALHVVARARLPAAGLLRLRRRARALGAEAAAAEFLAARPAWPGGRAAELRVGVLLPLSGPREAYDGAALAAAAELAEEDAAGGAPGLSFKVELYDDGCSATRAFKYLTDSLGSEYRALTAVAGPACAAAFADVARQARPLRLPLLAYTAAASAGGALRAAGGAREQWAAWGALLAAQRWRRLAVLSERAVGVDLPLLRADVVVHVELHDDDLARVDEAVAQWAARVVAARARVLVVAAEDARVVRAALCAVRAVGLLPAAGAVWLLPGGLPARWLDAGGAARCGREELLQAAEGHLRLAPAWQDAWQGAAPGPAAAARELWERRWRARCRRGLSPADESRSQCTGPAPAHAALLYDALRLWAAALLPALARCPAAGDDLHAPGFLRELVKNVTSIPYKGLTGEFNWTEDEDGAGVRDAPLVLQQWRDGALHRVGRWARGTLSPGPEALRWVTRDGAPPTDGADCALQPLADWLGAGCRAAGAALAAVLLALLLGVLSALALVCRRRAERRYRARLAALGLRTLSAASAGVDRWELPRERVVINRKLGTGAFGTVYGGHALLAVGRGWSAVAVKTLKAGAATEEKLDFLSEAETMKRFEHKNVVKLLGVVTKTEPVCTVMEYMLYGDLRNYLLARRHLAGDEAAAPELAAPRLTAMALDAARALSYLAQQRYVHRDVAARNCLVSASRVVKLADFGMTRLVFENDYYRLGRKGMLPVRWMAPESLALGVFSPASDVWAFGVLLYEIVTLGSLPFQGLSNAEVLARVKAGHTLDLPPGLKPQLQGLMRACWRRQRGARPGAADVAALLADWPRLLAPVLDAPLDALPLDRPDADGAEARWVSWAAPASAATDATDATDATYLSAEAPPTATDALLPERD